jgi:preprotein translocase subunit SecG
LSVFTILIVIHLFIGLALVALVLMQHGKGADAGAAFGAGASGTVFGARGAASFLTKTTGWLAAGFFATSLALAYVVNTSTNRPSVVESLAPVVQDAVQGEKPAASEPVRPADVPPAQ